MKIAIEGCAHGELQQIYDTIEFIQSTENVKVDLLICCGDFQASRNLNDLNSMAIPKKFHDICTFYKYYSGELEAPILTLFIGGNHEASNFLQELPYGGWVAKNIYYMGYAGVVNVNGLRIGGISGIFKHFDYQKGHFEAPPYSEDTKRSVYHVRQFDVWRMKQLSGQIDICVSHDWPRGIYYHGETRELIRAKPFFAGEIESNSLGSRANEELLNALKPSFWFSAHLHCKFAAVVEHKGGQRTKFLALDKCLPKRRFLHIVDAGEELKEEEKPSLSYDLEWLTILHLTNHLISVRASPNYLPNRDSTEERGNFTPTEEELEAVKKRFGDDLRVKEIFVKTAPAHDPKGGMDSRRFSDEPVKNPQTSEFCEVLNIDDPLQLVLAMAGRRFEEYSEESVEVVDDRDVVIEEEQIVERTRTSLSLPAPKSSEETQSDPGNKQNPEEINLSDEETREDEILPIPTDVDAGGDTADPVPVEEVKEEEKVEVENATPPVKKFKRRNESIYTANSDDE